MALDDKKKKKNRLKPSNKNINIIDICFHLIFVLSINIGVLSIHLLYIVPVMLISSFPSTDFSITSFSDTEAWKDVHFEGCRPSIDTKP